MDATTETVRFETLDRAEHRITSPQFWHDSRQLKVLGMGIALPGPPVSTEELLTRVQARFDVPVSRRGAALAKRLNIVTRHICRDLSERHEAPRPGQSNPDLAATAVRNALNEAGLGLGDLAYLVSHTTTPARLAPPNVALVADRLSFAGPYVELRQACTGFANALMVAQGLVFAPSVKAVAIVGSETGSVYFDPHRAGQDVSQMVNLIMMGDGAAAIILGPDDSKPGARISLNFFGHIGLGRQSGFSLTGGSDEPFVERQALEFAHDFAAVRDSGPELFYQGAIAARSLGADPVKMDRVIPHQANGRMDELLGPFLGVDPAKIFVNAHRLGNTGSAAIWLALAQLRSKLDSGATVLALGAEATKFMFGGFRYIHG